MILEDEIRIVDDRAKEKHNSKRDTVAKHWRDLMKKPIAVCDLRPEHFFQFREYLLKTIGISTGACWSYESRMNAALNILFKQSTIAKNPMRQIERLKQVEGTRDFLTINQLRLLVKTPMIVSDDPKFK